MSMNESRNVSKHVFYVDFILFLTFYFDKLVIYFFKTASITKIQQKWKKKIERIIHLPMFSHHLPTCAFLLTYMCFSSCFIVCWRYKMIIQHSCNIYEVEISKIRRCKDIKCVHSLHLPLIHCFISSYMYIVSYPFMQKLHFTCYRDLI